MGALRLLSVRGISGKLVHLTRVVSARSLPYRVATLGFMLSNLSSVVSRLCLNFTGDSLPLSLRLLAVATSGAHLLFSRTSFVNWDSLVMRRCCFVYLYFVCHLPHMVPPLGGTVLCLVVCIVLTPASGSSFTFSRKLFNRSSSFIFLFLFFAIYIFIPPPPDTPRVFSAAALGSATFPNSLPSVPRTLVCPILEPHLVSEDLQSL